MVLISGKQNTGKERYLLPVGVWHGYCCGGVAIKGVAGLSTLWSWRCLLLLRVRCFFVSAFLLSCKSCTEWQLSSLSDVLVSCKSCTEWQLSNLSDVLVSCKSFTRWQLSSLSDVLVSCKSCTGWQLLSLSDVLVGSYKMINNTRIELVWKCNCVVIFLIILISNVQYYIQVIIIVHCSYKY